jgi:competence protein ComEA
METPNWRQILAALIGMVMLGIVGFFGQSRQNRIDSQVGKTRPLAKPKSNASRKTETAEQVKATEKIIIDIRGAINKPGLYEIEPGSRLNSLIDLAGGLTRNADLDQINLAERLKDGSKIVIPAIAVQIRSFTAPQNSATLPRTNAPNAETSAPFEPQPNTTNPPEEFQNTNSQPKPEPKIISVNSATVADFDTLPGIGPVVANRIIDYRTQAGGFKSIDELELVRGIGPKLMDKIRAYLSL